MTEQQQEATFDRHDPLKHLYRAYAGRLCWDCGEARNAHVEPTCAKCLQVIELSAHPETERYEMSIVNPDGTLGSISWKVHKARAIVKADPRPTRRIDSESLAMWLGEHASAIEAEHIDHIPPYPDRIGSEPGLMVVTDELNPDDGGKTLRPVAILIDGTHRAARAVRDGESFFVYVLTDVEMMACLDVIDNADFGMTPGTPRDLSETNLEAASPS